MLARLAEVCIAAGSSFSFTDLDGTTRAAFDRGYAAGKRQVSEGFSTPFVQIGRLLGPGSNWGWFGTDFLRRAIVAGFGWGGARPHSHTAAFLFKNAADNPFNSHARRYTMTFDTAHLPPVSRRRPSMTSCGNPASAVADHQRPEHRDLHRQ